LNTHRGRDFLVLQDGPQVDPGAAFAPRELLVRSEKGRRQLEECRHGRAAPFHQDDALGVSHFEFFSTEGLRLQAVQFFRSERQRVPAPRKLPELPREAVLYNPHLLRAEVDVERLGDASAGNLAANHAGRLRLSRRRGNRARLAAVTCCVGKAIRHRINSQIIR
jgi:hypothetical protein